MVNSTGHGGKIMDVRRYKKGMVPLMVILALMLGGSVGVVLSPLTIASAREAVVHVVQGKVVAIETNAVHRGIIEVKSHHSGEIFKFYVGNRTAYYPHRYPYIGEKVTVHYFIDRGYLKATQVEIR
jgi:hypothetical protein